MSYQSPNYVRQESGENGLEIASVPPTLVFIIIAALLLCDCHNE